MINSFNKKNNFITPEKAASFIPVFISSGISILLIMFFVIPQYVKSNKVNLELNGLIKKKNELNDLKSQYKIINQKFAKLNREKLSIIELISGTSNLDTLLTKLGKIGKRNKIEFVSIVPKKIIYFTETNPNDNSNKNIKQANLISDPLLVEGTKKYLIDVTLKTNFINLLSFLRELEFQENVILIDDMDLKLAVQNSNNLNIDNSQGLLEVKLKVSTYGKL